MFWCGFSRPNNSVIVFKGMSMVSHFYSCHFFSFQCLNHRNKCFCHLSLSVGQTHRSSRLYNWISILTLLFWGQSPLCTLNQEALGFRYHLYPLGQMWLYSFCVFTFTSLFVSKKLFPPLKFSMTLSSEVSR